MTWEAGSNDERSADQAYAALERLNHDFYRLDPSAYFIFRLRNLLLSAGCGLELEQMMGEGVEVGVFKVSSPNGATLKSLDKEKREAQHSFVTLETEVLLHHVAETLLRLYLAHEHSPPCPWVSMSRERSPRRFKTKVAHLLERLPSEEGRDRMSGVFFGGTDPAALGEGVPSETRWAALNDSCRAWLSWFGRYILDGDVYNAAKHGLGVYPQRIALTVEIDGEAFLNGSGPCLEYLHVVRGAEGQREWRRATKWIQWDRLFACIHIACQLIHRLWTVASVRYGDVEAPELELRVFASPAELFETEEMALAKFSHSLGFNADALT